MTYKRLAHVVRPPMERCLGNLDRLEATQIHRRIDAEGTHNRRKCDERQGKLWVEKRNKKRQDRENCVTCYVREIKLHVKPGYHRVNDKEMMREF